MIGLGVDRVDNLRGSRNQGIDGNGQRSRHVVVVDRDRVAGVGHRHEDDIHAGRGRDGEDGEIVIGARRLNRDPPAVRGRGQGHTQRKDLPRSVIAHVHGTVGHCRERALEVDRIDHLLGGGRGRVEVDRQRVQQQIVRGPSGRSARWIVDKINARAGIVHERINGRNQQIVVLAGQPNRGGGEILIECVVHATVEGHPIADARHRFDGTVRVTGVNATEVLFHGTHDTVSEVNGLIRVVCRRG